jgi:hypothetical protein
MAILVPTVQTLTRDGVTPTFGAANADGYALPGDGRTWIEVKNTNGATRTVTIDIPGVVDGLVVTDKAVVVPITTGDKIIGPFPPATYNQVAGVWPGYVLITFTSVVDVTIGFFRLP